MVKQNMFDIIVSKAKKPKEMGLCDVCFTRSWGTKGKPRRMTESRGLHHLLISITIDRREGGSRAGGLTIPFRATGLKWQNHLGVK